MIEKNYNEPKLENHMAVERESYSLFNGARKNIGSLPILNIVNKKRNKLKIDLTSIQKSYAC